MQQLYSDLKSRENCLDDDDNIIPGKGPAVVRAEEDFHGCRLMRNAFWKFRSFCIYSQCPPDSLHLADSGIFPQILFAIVTDFKAKILPFFDNPKDAWEKCLKRIEHRSPLAVYLHDVPIVWGRLGSCLSVVLTCLNSTCRLSKFKLLQHDGLSAYVCRILNLMEPTLEAGLKDSKTPILRAWEYRRLMMVGPMPAVCEMSHSTCVYPDRSPGCRLCPLHLPLCLYRNYILPVKLQA